MRPKSVISGFTLLEVMIVMAVISTLASIALPLYVSHTERARSAVCLANRETINKEIMADMAAGNNPPESLSDVGYPQSLCPSGGVYVLVPAAEGREAPTVACSLHHWPKEKPPPPPPPPPLIGDWPLEEGAGLSIGTAPLQGIIHNAEWIAGKVGSALQFDGINNGLDDYVQIPAHASLNLTDQGTLQAWINPKSTRPYGGIIHKGNLSSFSDEAYSLQYYGGKLALGVVSEDGINFRMQTSIAPPIRKWTHVATTWGADGIILYVNGQQVKATLYQSSNGVNWTRANDQQQVVVVRVTTGDVHIGAQLDQSYNNSLRNLGFNGGIDEVKILNSVLSSHKILTYVQSTL